MRVHYDRRIRRRPYRLGRRRALEDPGDDLSFFRTADCRPRVRSDRFFFYEHAHRRSGRKWNNNN